jgi:putative ATP-dependent endonuclease of the OLD family
LYIKSITLSNFRCFGPVPTTATFDDLICFVGHNGSGKSAILQSIVKLFGVSQSDRTLKSVDFHVPKGQKLDDEETRSLTIEAVLVFPELSSDGDTSNMAVPEFFNQMTVEEPRASPYCKIRLEGTWSQGNTAEGDLEQNLYWITASDEAAEEPKIPVTASQRSQIHVYYVPAIRDPLSQIKHVTGSIMHRLIRAINWSDEFKKSHEDLVVDFKAAFKSEQGVNTIQSSLSELWGKYSGTDLYNDIQITPISSDLKKAVSKLEVLLSPSPDGGEEDVTRLSEGLRSLFYFSLIQSVFHIEETVLNSDAESNGFNNEYIKPPYLTIFAVEEPENHLSPHYLGRITKIFRELSLNSRAQTILTSHSSSILKRVYPEEVRHSRLDENSKTIISEIVLPEQTDQAYKYVRNAVQAYPELYFAKYVVLCEGDSEEIVLPRIFEAQGLSIDENFISIVPLGGRHVNHFWRLLSRLGIPYVTLLDYDRRRETGGWARIKYALKQLIENGVAKNNLLKLEDGSILTDTKLEDMHNWKLDIELEKGWRESLENYKVFFSYPLDFDFVMLKAFPDSYKRPSDGGSGPNIPIDLSEDDYKALRNAYAAVIKKNPESVTRDMSKLKNEELFFWYRYLFLGRSKPVSHFRMISEIDEKELIGNCPKTLKDIITKIKIDNLCL